MALKANSMICSLWALHKKWCMRIVWVCCMGVLCGCGLGIVWVLCGYCVGVVWALRGCCVGIAWVGAWALHELSN